MEADVHGSQRKVLGAAAAPLKRAHGDEGIPLRGGQSLPFAVTRQWSAPAGHYTERWYLVHPDTREILFEGREREISVWGLQSLTELRDEVMEPIELEPGTYLLVFSLGGLLGGQFEIEASEAPAEEAA